MRFLLDAHLPRQLAVVFQSLGQEAIHTLDLPKKNKTPDEEIIAYSITFDRIVTTKDADFVDAFYMSSFINYGAMTLPVACSAALLRGYSRQP